jgi:hypothetical protein
MYAGSYMVYEKDIGYFGVIAVNDIIFRVTAAAAGSQTAGVWAAI